MKEPNFFVIGAPKCGTTALAKYLAEHPQVFMSDPKEPHYFNTDIDHGSFKDRDKYLGLFEESTAEHTVVGEASVWYLYSQKAIGNIEAGIECPKYIVMLRNPVDMVSSLHEQNVYSGTENLRDLETAWNAIDDRMAGKRLSMFAGDPVLLNYRAACSLGSQLDRFFAIVPPERRLVLFMEDLKANPREFWLKVQAFLGVEDDGRAEFEVVNSAKVRRVQFLKRANDAYVAFRQRFGFKPLGTGFFAKLNRWNHRSRSRPPLDPRFRAMLLEEFKGEIDKIENLTGRDLQHWRRPESQ